MIAENRPSVFARLAGLPLFLCLLPACAAEPMPSAPDDAPVLESAEVTSGGIGVLLSSDFTEFQLAPAVDSTDGMEIVPNRWTNFAVMVEGSEVDSWRLEDRADAIAFRVPLGHSGGLTVDVTGESIVDASLAAHRLGLVATFNYNHDCVDLEIVRHEPSHVVLINRLVGLRPDLVSFPTTCYEVVQDPDGVRTVVSGHGVLVPQRAGSLRFIAEGSHSYEFGEDPELRTWMSAAGGTFVDGQVLLERAAPPDSGPDVWRVRPGADVEFIEPVSCPELPTLPFALIEFAPGLCLTFDGSGAVRRNGELVFEYSTPCCSAWPALGFVVASNGRSLLTGFEAVTGHFDLERLTPSSMPVFDSDGSLLYEVDAYRAIYAAVFSPSGGELLVAGAVEDGEEFTPVIDRRDAATGELILRRERLDWRTGENVGSNDVRGARMVDGALWIATSGSEAGWQQPPAALEIVDVQSLETLRTVAVPAGPVHNYGTNVGLYPGMLIVPDPSGRRATLVSRWDGLDGLVGFTIDVYPD